MKGKLHHIGVGAALGGGLTASLAAGLGKHRDKKGKPIEKKVTPSDRFTWGLRAGVAGAISGGLLGHEVHGFRSALNDFKAYSQARRAAGAGGYSARSRVNSSPSGKMPDWLKGATNKAEAKAKYRAMSRQHHPDLGGSTDKMKKINEEWDSWQGKFKEAMLFAFADELEKIARASR